MSYNEPITARKEHHFFGPDVNNGFSDDSVTLGMHAAIRHIADARAQGGQFSEANFLDLMRSANDYQQITNQEWAQIYAFVKANQGSFDRDAMAAFEKLDRLVQDRGTAGDPGANPNGIALDGAALAGYMNGMETFIAERAARMLTHFGDVRTVIASPRDGVDGIVHEG
jgi:hypothetical protein